MFKNYKLISVPEYSSVKMKVFAQVLLFLAIILVSCSDKRFYNNEILLSFIDEPGMESDSANTIASLQSINDVYTLRYFGDYTAILNMENEDLKKNAKVSCSIFSVDTDKENLLGRNLDQQFDVKNVLISKYCPVQGYRSVGICALDFLTGNHEICVDSLTDFMKRQILKSPFYIMDGINEKGLAVGIAAVESQEIAKTNNKEKIDILLLNRLILDNAASVDEAVEIADKYDVFDEDINTVSHHYLVADSYGNSVIIEYQDGHMQFIYDNKSDFQIITNSLVKDRSLEERNANNRYLKINEPLRNKEILTKRDAMKLLKKASWGYPGGPAGTQWSVIYDLNNSKGFLTVDRKYSDIYVFSLK
ncbi:MAG: linear amide C-N hydrolase [Bacteroidales bacterium]|nr:linear amide C-N hydrolase [Bacteroidales bacterium]